MSQARPIHIGELVSWPLHVLFVAVAVVASWLFLQILPDLPDRVPTHWNGRGEPDGWGSPHGGWMMLGIMVLDYGIVWVAAATSLRRPDSAEFDTHREAFVQTRRLAVRMLEWMLLGCNVAFAVLWVGTASAGLSGRDPSGPPGIVLFLVVLAAAIILPIAIFARLIHQATLELYEIGGVDAVGSRPDRWKAKGMIYYAPDDPAVWVPKLIGTGYTLNFARPAAWLLLVLLLFGPLVVVALIIIAAGE